RILERDEAEAARAPGVAIRDHRRLDDRAEPRERGAEPVGRGVPAQAAHEQARRPGPGPRARRDADNDVFQLDLGQNLRRRDVALVSLGALRAVSPQAFGLVVPPSVAVGLALTLSTRISLFHRGSEPLPVSRSSVIDQRYIRSGADARRNRHAGRTGRDRVILPP